MKHIETIYQLVLN